MRQGQKEGDYLGGYYRKKYKRELIVMAGTREVVVTIVRLRTDFKSSSHQPGC